MTKPEECIDELVDRSIDCPLGCGDGGLGYGTVIREDNVKDFLREVFDCCVWGTGFWDGWWCRRANEGSVSRGGRVDESRVDGGRLNGGKSSLFKQKLVQSRTRRSWKRRMDPVCS